MRLTRILLAYKKHHSKARLPQNMKKIPFDPILPMKLKDRGLSNYFFCSTKFNEFPMFSVSGKVDAQKQVACLHEMSVLFASLKDHDFNEAFCEKEITALNKANILAMNTARESKLKNAGFVTTIGRDLNSKQLNKYLKKFPVTE